MSSQRRNSSSSSSREERPALYRVKMARAQRRDQKKRNRKRGKGWTK